MSHSAGSVGRSVSNDRLLEGRLMVRLLTTLPLSLEQYCEIVRQKNTTEACEKLIYKFSVRYNALSSQGTYSGTEFFMHQLLIFVFGSTFVSQSTALVIRVRA